MRKPEIKDKDGLLTRTSWLKKEKRQEKSSRKIVLKRTKSQLFGTNLNRNLVKIATFWDKLGQ